MKRVETPAKDNRRPIKSYVLRSFSLKPSQQQAIDQYSQEYAIEFDSSKPIDFTSLFNREAETIIEIGFGMGRSTIEIAKQFPHKNFLGIEVFLNGYAHILKELAQHHITNVKVIRFDAVEVLEKMILDNSVDGFHIFFPDPWPKKKHHKRRLIQLPFSTLLQQKLKSGAYIYCVTDWEEYANQMLSVFDQTPNIINVHHGFAPPKTWRPTTSFEKKGLEKKHPINEVWVEKHV
ncbi:MAG: tRNA (guanosine(46)-N7)-methyltransferase TrmB [Sphaerochaetaceae bacterium]|jgi:tRNA (guanine-N7-)-methyltransferase